MEGRTAMAVDQRVEQFSSLEDPRCAGKIEHRLLDILVIAVCAVIACAESWNDITLYGRSQEAWLKTFLALPHGIPSHDPFRRMFMLIEPDTFETRFAAWTRSLGERMDREVVAIDGQTRPPLLRPRPRPGAAALGQRLGQRARPDAGSARGRWPVERDHRHSRTAGRPRWDRAVQC